MYHVIKCGSEYFHPNGWTVQGDAVKFSDEQQAQARDLPAVLADSLPSGYSSCHWVRVRPATIHDNVDGQPA